MDACDLDGAQVAAGKYYAYHVGVVLAEPLISVP